MANNLKLFNDTLRGESTQRYLSDVLGERKSAFVNNIVALVGNNTQLQQCAPTELIFAALKATSLDLPFDANLGFAYVIPYVNRKEGVTHAQFQLGYKGFIQLAIRSGQFKTLNVRDVREGELVGEDFISGQLTFKVAASRETLPVIGYVAYMELTNGFSKMLYMTNAELDAHATKYSQTYKSSYTKASSKWATDFDAMAKKTVLKLLLSKYSPMSVQTQQMATALQADQSVVTSATSYEYIDNQFQPVEEDAAAAAARAEAKAVEVASKVAKNKAKIKAARKAATQSEPAPAPAAETITEQDEDYYEGGGMCPHPNPERGGAAVDEDGNMMMED